MHLSDQHCQAYGLSIEACACLPGYKRRAPEECANVRSETRAFLCAHRCCEVYPKPYGRQKAGCKRQLVFDPMAGRVQVVTDSLEDGG